MRPGRPGCQLTASPGGPMTWGQESGVSQRDSRILPIPPWQERGSGFCLGQGAPRTCTIPSGPTLDPRVILRS